MDLIAQARIVGLLAVLFIFVSSTHAFAQSCVQPPPGIIAWWSLDETSGTIAGDRVGNHPTAYANAPMPAEGQVRGALRFNGSNYAAAADSNEWAFGSGDFSIELWANFDAPGGGSIGHPGDIFIGHDEGPGSRNKWFFALGGGFLNFHINSPSIGPKFFPLVPFSPVVGQWYHLAVVRSGSTYTIFVDGVPRGSATNTDVIPNPSAPLTIGQAENLGFTNGRLDEVTVYNRALSQEELRAIVEAGGAGKCIYPDIRPNSGGDTGTVSVNINGTGFSQGGTVKLVMDGEPDIVGDAVTVGENGTTITATFDLAGRTRGAWDVIIENPDGTNLAIPSGFNIEKSLEEQLWADVVGLNLLRPGRPQTFWIACGNRGNVNSYNATVMLGGIPISVKTRTLFDLPFHSIPQWVESQAIESSLLKFSEEKAISIIIPEIGAGQQQFFPVELTATSNENFTLDTYVKQGAVVGITSEEAPECTFNQEDTDALLRALKLANDVFWNGNPLTLIRACSGAADEYGEYLNKEMDKPDSPLHNWSWLPVKNVCHHANLLISPSGQGERRYYIIWHFPTLTLFPVRSVGDHWEPCDSNGKKSSQRACPFKGDSGRLKWSFSGEGVCPLWDTGGSSDVTIIQSFDPNDKAGSGVGGEHYVSGQQPLRYAITFENLETATAPAQEVVIADQLDTVDLDLSTFSLGPIAFGNSLVTPPPGRSDFTTNVDLRPGKNLIVRVTGSLNPNTGLLTWRLTSIDPVTGDLPADPRVGFLPPNVNPPEGDGSVLFTVMPKQGLSTGTNIRNKAIIVFDTNEPIDTPGWLNTLDNDKPQSQVAALASTVNTASYPVAWSGTDVGAGVKDYTIYVSENGGPFAPWLQNTTEISSIFTGKYGSSYAFYSVARDLTGNIEDAPSVPDAVISLVQQNKPPIANAGTSQTVRLGSLATLDGSTSSDPDNGPASLSYVWTQSSGPSASLGNSNTANPTFTPNTSDIFAFSLTVNDGAADSTPSSVTITVPKLGDVDGDGDVDNNDLNLILAARNTRANGPNDLRDLDGDGTITALDARKLTTLCTRLRCATQ